MAHKIFSYPVLIKEAHLDTFGHVNNATYLELLEEARWEMMIAGGYGIDKIRETGLGPTILEITITFLKELRLREEIMIQTQVLEYRNKIGIIAHEIFREGMVCTTAKLKFGLFSLRERKLVLPTKEWLGVIGVE